MTSSSELVKKLDRELNGSNGATALQEPRPGAEAIVANVQAAMAQVHGRTLEGINEMISHLESLKASIQAERDQSVAQLKKYIEQADSTFQIIGHYRDVADKIENSLTRVN